MNTPKRKLAFLAVALMLLAAPFPSHARFETLVVRTVGETNSIIIESYETVRIASVTRQPGSSSIRIFKSGAVSKVYNTTTEPHVVRGPAVVEFSDDGTGTRTAADLLTLEITPEAFDPTKTLIVPPGTNQVAVTLECSTNLVNWMVATNGIYGSPIEAKFFRIRADRIP